MKSILISLCIGIVAGIIDVVPMIKQKLDRYSCISAFVFWVVLAFIIPYVNWQIQPWLKGLIIAEMSAVPLIIIVYPKDPKALIPMIVFSAVLGAAVGFTGAVFIG